MAPALHRCRCLADGIGLGSSSSVLVRHSSPGANGTGIWCTKEREALARKREEDLARGSPLRRCRRFPASSPTTCAESSRLPGSMSGARRRARRQGRRWYGSEGGFLHKIVACLQMTTTRCTCPNYDLLYMP